MAQIVGEKGEDVTGRRDLWSQGPSVGAGLICVKNHEEACGAGVKETKACGNGDEVREVMERWSRAV